MSRKLLFVFNPLAGGKHLYKEDVPAMFKKFCLESDFDFFIYQTTGKEDQESIKKIIQDNNPDAVIAAGGDGTVNLVGEVMVNSNIPMGIIPMGSANGLARDLNIPQDMEEALQVIKRFVSHPIDSLEVNGMNCFHVSDFGFNARIVRRFSKSILRGKISYLWYGLTEFFFFEPFQYIIETGEQKIKGEAFMMTVTNANRFGTNVNINPLGKIDDGYFEISIIKPFSKLKAFKILYRLFHNTIHKSKYNRVIRCKSAVIYNIENTSFHIDGEPAQLQERIEVNIVPKGLCIFVP
jgi:diacylglycerol kinase (ATP)